MAGGGVMLSILYIIIMVACLAGLLCCPKAEKSINGVKAVIAGSMALLCYQVIVSMLFYVSGVTVGLFSMGAATLLPAVALWLVIWKKKRIQKMFWRLSDVISVLLLLAFVLWISIDMFGTHIGLRYLTVDAAKNFADTMQVVRSGSMQSFNIQTVVEVLFIELCAPFLSAAEYYKAVVLADISMRILEICMFYVLARTISDKKIMQIMAPIFAIAYFWGYPVYNFMTGNYPDWSTGVMMLEFVIYVLLLLEKRKDAWKEKYGTRLYQVAAVLAVVLVIAILVLFFLRHDAWLVQITQSSYGGTEIYASLYAELVFFLPALIYVCYYVFLKKMDGKVLGILSILAIAWTVYLYNIWFDGGMSNYYYYRNYYTLWLFGWLLAAQALAIAAETKELAEYFSYLGFIAVLAVIVLSDYEGRMADKHMDYDGAYVTKNFFGLYRYNADTLLLDYAEDEVSVESIAVYDYVAENCGAERVPILTEDLRTRLWYDALTGKKSEIYSLAEFGLPDVLEALEMDGVGMVAIQKDAEEYELYQDYFARCEVIYETEDAAVYGKPGDTWLSAYDEADTDYAAREELYSYVRDELAGTEVPLMARKASYLDFIIYKDITGISSTEYYTWMRGELDNIINLNAHGAKYVVLLKNDDYYIGNAGYYERYETVFENELGKIITCGDEEWGTSY